MNLHSLFCCFVQLFFHLHTKHKTSFTNNLSPCQNQIHQNFPRQRDFHGVCSIVYWNQNLPNFAPCTREGEDQFSINNVKLIAINQLVLVKAFKVMYQLKLCIKNENIFFSFILPISTRKYYLIFNYCLPPSFSHSVEWISIDLLHLNITHFLLFLFHNPIMEY